MFLLPEVRQYQFLYKFLQLQNIFLILGPGKPACQ